ncbi:MAG: DUF4878 domain-containing protein [Chitinophagaceae bacterium]
MKKLLTSLLIVTAVITLVVACKGKDKVANDPKAVLVAFFERMAKKDMEGAAKLATKESQGTMEMMKKAMTMAEDMKGTLGKEKDSADKDPSEDFKNMKIGEAKIDGDKATVSVTNPSKDDKTVEFPLKKEGGEWKVDFSMGTLMKMGMDQAGKSGGLDGFGTDADTVGINDKMNNLMNADSLKEGLEKLDSALKSLDPEKMKEMKDALKSLEKLKD